MSNPAYDEFRAEAARQVDQARADVDAQQAAAARLLDGEETDVRAGEQ